MSNELYFPVLSDVRGYSLLDSIAQLPNLGVSKRELKMRARSNGCKIRVMKDRVDYFINDKTCLSALYWIIKHHDVTSVEFIYGKKYWQDCVEISLHRDLNEAICS